MSEIRIPRHDVSEVGSSNELLERVALLEKNVEVLFEAVNDVARNVRSQGKRSRRTAQRKGDK